jgi:hypothetical protein
MTAVSKIVSAEMVVEVNARRRPIALLGKANVLREETGKCTLEAAGIGVQTRREG